MLTNMKSYGDGSGGGLVTDDPDTDGDDDSTKSVTERHWLTNDLLAPVVLMFYFGTIWGVGMGRFDQAILEGTSGYVLHAIALSVVVWGYGTAALREFRGNER